MIRTEKLEFTIGDFNLRDLNLEIPEKTYFVMLGPPGSGKTVFLECLCGLKRPRQGRIFIDGKNVTTLEPRKRGIGYVPQDYALFPHLSVEKNIAFGLRNAGHDSRSNRRKITQIAEMLTISGLLERNVTDLSGGEKQRTALARALVVEPEVLLLDEPVCALDEGTRQTVCAMLLDIQRKLRLTVIHVSHNLEEAFSVADRAAILNQGILQQVGPLGQLLRKPQNEFVARFMRCENIFTEQQDVKLARPHPGKAGMMIRPENILLLPIDECGTEYENQFIVEIARYRDFGAYVKVELAGPLNLVAHLTHAAFERLQIEPGRQVKAVLPPQSIHTFHP
ncbi:MAG: ABC transporter ATP-binding protein [Sedimentisphaerales bacterium]|nr:ABC transporter ATP-binding protein [Sedimentisphaerales bacterium]